MITEENNIIYATVDEAPNDKGFRIEELKQKLSDTDYIACKIAEGSATIEEYSEVIEQRRLWREEINNLETEIM